jgi:uncharacterized protein
VGDEWTTSARLIVADTSAIVALLDLDDRWHRTVRKLFEAARDDWVLPWAVLPEVDYMLLSNRGGKAQRAFHDDLVNGAFVVEWGTSADLVRARNLHAKYATLDLGLTDGVVVSVAERLGADAIATLDVRHFGALAIKGRPKILPRDLA